MNFFNRFQRLRDSMLLTILILGIGALVLFLSSQHFIRWDMTEDQHYSLSETTRTVARNLDDLIIVRMYFSQTLPPNLAGVRSQVVDLLEDLAAYSNGKIQIKSLNPGIPQVAEEAKALGIPMVRMNILEKDKVEVKNGFLGIALTYGSQTAILPVVDDTQGLEYDLLVALKKLVQPQHPILGVVVDENRKGDFKTLLADFAQHYELREMPFASAWDTESLSALLLLDPRQPFTTRSIEALKGVLKENKPVLLFADPYLVDDSLSVRRNPLGLDGFLSEYGVRLDTGFVMDPSNVETQFKQGNHQVLLPYPFWVKALSGQLDRQSPIVSSLPSVVLPWTTPLILELTTGVAPVTLIRSSDKAAIQAEPFDLHPTASVTKPLGSKSLAVILGRAGEGSLLFVPNARMLSDSMAGQFRENLIFAMNAVDHLIQDDGLIALRSSTLKDYPITSLSDRQRHVVKWLGTFLMPLLMIAYGISRAVNRKMLTSPKKSNEKN